MKIISVVILCLSSFLCSCSKDNFITVWDTTKPGKAKNNQITLPLVENGCYDFIVNWGDGTEDHITFWNDEKRTHVYPKPGRYTVKIEGEIDGWSFVRNYFKDRVNPPLDLTNHKPIYVGIIWDGISDDLAFYNDNTGYGDEGRLIEIKRWGSLGLGNTDGQFAECKNLIISAKDSPSLENTTSLVCLFTGCKNLDTRLDLTKWDVSGIIDFRHMFQAALYEGEDYILKLNNWDVSNALDMSYMFSGVSFNIELSDWDTLNVLDMSYMFSGASGFNDNLSTWDVSNVKNMEQMFYSAKLFNQDLSTWNLVNVVNLKGTFSEATSFNQELSTWDVSSVKEMDYMFAGASSFDQNLSSWDFSSVESIKGFLQDAKLSLENYDALLISLSEQDVHHNLDFHGGDSQYSEKGESARNKLINEYGWTITDGGPVSD